MSGPDLEPIGRLRTPHVDPAATPLQPCFAREVEGEALLDPAFADGLEGLEGFSHAYLLYRLHRAGPWSLRTRPFLGDHPVGIFACRHPARPNALGLSLVRIRSVEGRRVVFTGADMLDGSPLLDLKPFFPGADVPEAAWGGWTEGVTPETARTRGVRRDPPPDPAP